MNPPASWTREAARLPVAFSQVREDPLVDAALLEPGARVVMIASGGDTVALLAATGRASYLQLVDANPAQLALTRLKLYLLRHNTPAERLALLGHRPMDAARRAAALGDIRSALGLPDEIFGPPELVARLGPDHAGRYEILFARLRDFLLPQRDELAAALALADPAEQTRRTAPGTRLGAALDSAFDSVMALENLVGLFGEEATRNPRQSFARHFAERTRHALATFPARENPFLAQLLLGTFQDGAAYDWLTQNPPASWPEILCSHSTMAEALRALPRESADFVHLSNILDWLSPQAAAATLALAWEALRPGGVMVIRQLNSSLEIPPLEKRFIWQPDRADALHRRDRSFFYRALYIGQKPVP